MIPWYKRLLEIMHNVAKAWSRIFVKTLFVNTMIYIHIYIRRKRENYISRNIGDFFWQIGLCSSNPHHLIQLQSPLKDEWAPKGHKEKITHSNFMVSLHSQHMRQRGWIYREGRVSLLFVSKKQCCFHKTDC